MNVVRLLPVFLLVVAVFFSGVQLYRYFTGVDEGVSWLLVGLFALIYFSVRSVQAVRTVFVWDDDQEDPVDVE